MNQFFQTSSEKMCKPWYKQYYEFSGYLLFKNHNIINVDDPKIQY